MKAPNDEGAGIAGAAAEPAGAANERDDVRQRLAASLCGPSSIMSPFPTATASVLQAETFRTVPTCAEPMQPVGARSPF
jgi:hypothetical protein